MEEHLCTLSPVPVGHYQECSPSSPSLVACLADLPIHGVISEHQAMLIQTVQDNIMGLKKEFEVAVVWAQT